jgi:hypothetical protein
MEPPETTTRLVTNHANVSQYAVPLELQVPQKLNGNQALILP